MIHNCDIFPFIDSLYWQAEEALNILFPQTHQRVQNAFERILQLSDIRTLQRLSNGITALNLTTQFFYLTENERDSDARVLIALCTAETINHYVMTRLKVIHNNRRALVAAGG